MQAGRQQVAPAHLQALQANTTSSTPAHLRLYQVTALSQTLSLGMAVFPTAQSAQCGTTWSWHIPWSEYAMP